MAGDVDGYIDTGSYIFNALVSGDIYRGIPSNKITALAGESATGKTFFALGMVQKFLEDNPEGNVVYFESESALTQEMLEERGIDTSRILLVPVTTIDVFPRMKCSFSNSAIEIYGIFRSSMASTSGFPLERALPTTTRSGSCSRFFGENPLCTETLFSARKSLIGG